MANLHTTTDGPFRDYLPGMEGRRSDLLRKRRDQLATMPHALRRVFVTRAARVAAAATACLGGAILIGAATHHSYEQYLASLLPGREPAVLSTVLLATLVASALAYLLGRCAAEARFTRAMSKCVLPDGDVTDDVERLAHVRPDSVASAMIGRFASPAAVLPAAAVGLIAPCVLAWLFLAVSAGGYPLEADVEALFARHSTPLLAIALSGLCASLVIGLAYRRSGLVRTTVLGIGAAAAVTVTTSLLMSGAVWIAIGFFLVSGAIVSTLAQLSVESSVLLSTTTAARHWTIAGITSGAWTLGRSAASQLTVANARRIPSLLSSEIRTGRGKAIAASAIACMAMATYTHWPAQDAREPARMITLATPGNSDITTAINPIGVKPATGIARASGQVSYATITTEANIALSDMAAFQKARYFVRTPSRQLVLIPPGKPVSVYTDITSWMLPAGSEVSVHLGPHEVRTIYKGEKTLNLHGVTNTEKKPLPLYIEVQTFDAGASGEHLDLKVRTSVVFLPQNLDTIE